MTSQDDGTSRPRVAIATLGCKVNQFESASFSTSFTDKGAELVPFSRQADIYVINTCAVTGKAASQSRQMIRRALRANPRARVVVTGCYAQVASRDVCSLGDEPLCIVGNGCKDQLVDIALAGEECDLEMFMGDIGRKKEICRLPVTDFGGRTRAYLKVQDGCDRFCSYCIVPYARGPSRSLPAAEVLEQARRFIDQGFREIVLTGIHIGLYGQDLETPLDLAGLLRRLLDLDDSVRWRVSSLESAEITSGLLALFAESPLVMPHLHIPLQSGDDHILQRMNRPYTTTDYRRVVEQCLAAVPDIAIGVDIMAGFPGEGEEHFVNTHAFLADLPIAYLHVFPYSRRPGTVAAEMKEQVPGPVKDERVAALRRLDAEKRHAFASRFVGSVRPVLAENSRNRLRLMRGFTDNYIPVYFPAPADAANSVCMVRITEVKDNIVLGEMQSCEER